jgi:hypothetical protein
MTDYIKNIFTSFSNDKMNIPFFVFILIGLILLIVVFRRGLQGLSEGLENKGSVAGEKKDIKRTFDF